MEPRSPQGSEEIHKYKQPHPPNHLHQVYCLQNSVLWEQSRVHLGSGKESPGPIHVGSSMWVKVKKLTCFYFAKIFNKVKKYIGSFSTEIQNQML